MSKDLSEPLRSHKDLDKDAAPFYKKAEKFYDGLANQLVNQGHVLDLFLLPHLIRYGFLYNSALFWMIILMFFFSCVSNIR